MAIWRKKVDFDAGQEAAWHRWSWCKEQAVEK